MADCTNCPVRDAVLEAIKLIREYKQENRDLEEALEEYKHILELQNTSVNQWICVDDKLPTTCENILIYDEYEGISAGYYDSDYAKFRVIYDIYRVCHVTHWQPLPEPPKQKI